MKFASKKQTGVTLRINIKMFNGNNLPHVLLLTTTQKAKLRNAFENNMWTDIKLSKTQISKIIQSEGFLCLLLSKIGSLMKVAVPLAKKYFSSIRNNNCCFSNWWRNFKENTWFWYNYFNNFEERSEWHNKNYSSSWRLIFYWK